MSKVKSLEDLKKVREEALKKQQAKSTAGHTQIIIGMGTVGIAAGARETLKTFLDMIETKKLEDIIIRQTGNIGLDSFEPIVQIVVGEQAKVSYGKVTPDIAEKIVIEHILGGNVLTEHVIES
ncbi:MAG: (2Fe-2S) ferredoxin domain-containing protein [Anaerolineaceae bacterium]|nr:(2Fe-2S) ferredoxin domain-containing protein [Anaerolineaceae bacterium]